MRKKNYKGRCIKRQLKKCLGVCKTYDTVQYAEADILAARDDVVEIRCNVILNGLETDAEYTSDFVCTKQNGELLVRECVFRRLLPRPKTAKLLELSRDYWDIRGVTDWGIVVDAEE